MATVALTFAVLDVTDSIGALGAVLAARTIPLIALLLLGGVISDRFSRVRLIQISNVISALSQGVIAALILFGSADLAWLIALSAVNGAASAISMPAMAAMVPDLVPHNQLQQANVLLALTRNGLTILGPTLGALIVVGIGSGWALAIDAATWVIAAILLIPVRTRRTSTTEKSSILSDLVHGWTYFRSTTWLWVVVAGFFVLNAINAGAWLTLGPVIADDTIGREGWGLTLSAMAIGFLLTSVVMLRVRMRRPLLVGMIGVSLLALPMVALALTPTLPILIVCAFIAGMGGELFGLGWNLAMQEQVPRDMLSRASSYDMLGSFAAMPLGQLAIAPVAAALGATEVLVGSAVLYASVCVAVLCSRSVRGVGRREDPPVAAESTAD